MIQLLSKNLYGQAFPTQNHIPQAFLHYGYFLQINLSLCNHILVYDLYSTQP